ncbi:hypothetical protein FA95DRAFT_1480491 [Auriscalpium vulgare]|uniref:Uncharacterized protein n=1 Tax=Auriscalpium vulgare TaxID=40419 RepID=A0ACB8SD66_9AGAM|nr:hypothetical protein FA95DRAFT_1480491 [Auriscalpium vulgare]
MTSPFKGKAKEEDHWQPGWWQLHPLVESCFHRPVVWTKASAILFAHPTRPAVVGHLFPSSHQFQLDSPAPIANTPASYEPPTIISIAPNDFSLFAYFPGVDVPGLMCIWTRGAQVDTWNVTEWMQVSRGGGVIASAWLGQSREWTTDTSRGTIRLPPLGPPTTGATLILTIVTQDMQVHIIHRRSNALKFTMITCSLMHPDEAHELKPRTIPQSTGGPEGLRECVSAAIGIAYNETSIMVATRSRVTSTPTTQPTFSSIDMSLGLPLPMPTEESDFQPLDWAKWVEDASIEVCEVRVGYDGQGMLLSTHPLPPIECHHQQFSKMVFVPADPPASSEDKQVPGPVAKIYLAASFVDFEEYQSVPKSELVVYALTRNESVGHPDWLISQASSRSFASEVLTFLCPYNIYSRTNTLVAGFVRDTMMPTLAGKRKPELSTGDIRILQLPSSNVLEGWSSVPILSTNAQRVSVPFNVALSPNGVLLCTVSPSSLLPAHVAVHPLPRLILSDPSGALLASGDVPTLVSAIRSRQTVADIIHRLSLPSTPLAEVEDVLFRAISGLEGRDDGLRSLRLHDFLGVLVEVYRTRAQRVHNDVEKEELTVRWKTAQDLCSLMACHGAFDDCENGDFGVFYGQFMSGVGFDRTPTDAVWPLSRLSAWTMDFLENLMKECVLEGDSGPQESDAQPGTIADILPIFIYLLHPEALTRLRTSIADVKRFYETLGRLNASGETAQLAKNILIDYVDSSGVNLKELDNILVQISEELKGSNDDMRRSLASCHPMPSLSASLRKVVTKISESKAIDKPRLFIKPSDLVTGIASMQLLDGSRMTESRDIISKGQFLNQSQKRVCLRCGGKTQQSDGRVKPLSLRWMGWESQWQSRCICGGLWATGPAILPV